jgi:D-2-hydroxyacid dehydrogenase (NADP+)
LNLLVFGELADAMHGPLAAAFPQLRITHAVTHEEGLPLIADAEILVATAPDVRIDLLRGARKLRWVQSLTSGTDGIHNSPVLPSDVIVTSMRGVHGIQMSELALTFMLALARDLRRMVRNQDRRTWDRWPQGVLAGATVTIAGVGLIGEALAVRCGALGMRVLGVSARRTAAPGFERIFPRSAVVEAAAEADFLVVLVPYDASTEGFIGDAVFGAMKPSAFLVNIARGGVVDEDALLDHLRCGSIAGAGLDVFKHEPLAPQSAFWDLPNVLITPHIGGLRKSYPETIFPHVAENIRAYLAGDIAALRNIVTRAGDSKEKDPTYERR